MLKTAIFLAAFIPGISGAALSVESQENQESLRAVLYFLKELDSFEKNNRKQPLQDRAFVDSIKHFLFHIEKLKGSTAEMKDFKTVDFSKTEGEELVIPYQVRYSAQQSVFDPKNSSAVKNLFQNDKNLLQWIKDNPELIYGAIQFGNLELVRFFVENGGSINAARKVTHFSPLHFAIISFRPDIIRWFLDHPQTDLRQTSVWGENLFHFVFLTGNKRRRQGGSVAQNGKNGKMQILDILFQPEYFVKIFDLLNVPNHHNETVLDFARNEGTGSNEKRIVSFLRSNGALSYGELEESGRAPPQTPKKGTDHFDSCFRSFQGHYISSLGRWNLF